MYLCSIILGFLSLASAQNTTPIDPSLLLDIFGTPPPDDTSGRHLEDITVSSTSMPTISMDKNGEECQCVPYYMCTPEGTTIDVENPSITGWGVLDIRFGENDNKNICQESVEVCCKAPEQTPKEKPQPDPSKLRGCGYRNPNGLGVTFMTNGNEAQFGEFPWVVALLDAQNGSYVGVGVIIHPQVVMTGAHIAYKYSPGGLKVRAGEWDTQTVKEIYDFQERDVDEIYRHKDFMPKSLKNDMALLRLKTPLQLAEHINMLCLPEAGENFDSYKDCVANGWGRDKFGLEGRFAVILKKVQVDMVPHGICNSLLKRTRLGSKFNLHSSFVCAGGEEGKDTCQGDGGAPLACPIENDRYKLTGLVAWGIGCGQKEVPAVYVNVPAFRTWVDDKMNQWGYGTATYTL